MLITRATKQDAGALARVMFVAIRQGATRYSVQQRRAWCPEVPKTKTFATCIATQDVWVARGCQGVQGFVSVRRDGYINLFFILPKMQGRGLFRRLMAQVEQAYPGALRVHASLHAEPPFLALGFRLAHRENSARNGQRLQRALLLRDPPRAT